MQLVLLTYLCLLIHAVAEDASITLANERLLAPWTNTSTCGMHVDCPRHYDIKDIELSASGWVEADTAKLDMLMAEHEKAKAACTPDMQLKEGVLPSGGWCLRTDGHRFVQLVDGTRYPIPNQHVACDTYIVEEIYHVLTSGRTPDHYLSLSDFGAGVGQYGYALRSFDPKIRYRGYDGAGNIEAYTKGFLQWIDLTKPLALPRSDWVMSLEVGEHIHHADEGMFIRNLHAHNCVGVVLSWAVLGQGGHSHVNCHSKEYVDSLFADLGYEADTVMRERMQNTDGERRNNAHGKPFRSKPHNIGWLRESVHVYRRITPLTGNGCGGGSSM